MTNHITMIIQRRMTIFVCIVFSMFLISCASAPKKMSRGNIDPVIYTEDITDRALKKSIIVGEHGGYWEYHEEIEETGYNLNAETDVSDSFCFNEWTCEEDRFPDTNSTEPYTCICIVGWRYHSVNGDSSPAMIWNIHCVASGSVNVMENSLVPSGGKAHSTAEALSSAKVTCDNATIRSERLYEKVESSKGSPLQSNIFSINTQPDGVLPAGSTSIELKAELSALVKTKSMAQAGLFCFLPPAQSSAKSHARVAINTLEFVNFHRVYQE
jgi:hypothetical protein